MMDWSFDFWLAFICIAGYLVSRIQDRNLRWRVFGFLQILSRTIWFFQFLLEQIGWLN